MLACDPRPRNTRDRSHTKSETRNHKILLCLDQRNGPGTSTKASQRAQERAQHPARSSRTNTITLPRIWETVVVHPPTPAAGSSWGLHWITPASPSSTQGSHGAAPRQRMQAGQTQDTCREYKRKGLVWNRDGGRSPTRTHFCSCGILSLEPLNIPLLCSTTVGPLTPGSRLRPHFTEWLCSLFRRRSGSNPV